MACIANGLQPETKNCERCESEIVEIFEKEEDLERGVKMLEKGGGGMRTEKL